MMLKRRIATLAAIAGCAVGVIAVSTPATASVSAAIPRGLLPMATSWLTPRSGLVLAYPSRNTGAKPYLLQTGNAGRTWKTLPPPPVPFPADNDQPDMTWAGGVIAVTDGTHILASREAGRHWSAVRLAGASGNFFVGELVITSGRVFALVTTQGSSSATTTVYSGAARAGVLRPVRGLSITGGLTYGDITAVGTLQVDLGQTYSTERYWYSRDGAHFVAAPLPCPVTTSAMLGGVRGGHAIALCSGDPSDVGPGQNDKQVWTATRLGAAFHAASPVFISPNGQDFAAATAQDMTVATAFNLGVTFNTGKTWADKLTQPNGAFWTDLSFQNSTTGVVDCGTVNNELKEIQTIYRTTDAGRTWRALSLP